MLTVHSIRNSRESRAFFKENFDPVKTTWLVSDLKSKLDLNRELLSEREFVSGHGILRASELWRILLTRLRPDLQIISREFAMTMIAHKLSGFELEWASAPGAGQAAFQYLTQLMPIIAHPEGAEMMTEWFSENPASEPRWRRWYDLTCKLWAEFLADGFIAPQWVSGVLVNETGFDEIWSRPLVVDLGAELTQVEADLLLLLSDIVDITVLKPAPSWAKEAAKTLAAYEIFDAKVGSAKSRSKESETAAATADVKHIKLTTMIAEVKDATARVRHWLSEGDVSPHQIAIVASDIEMYWPSLSAYLEQEGIPTQKNLVQRAHGFPDIARWLAVVRLRSGAHAEPDVELAFFDRDGSSVNQLGFDRFKTLFSVIYGREDFSRHELVAEKFSVDLQSSHEATRDEFVAWSLKLAAGSIDNEDGLSRIETIYKRLIGECPQSMRLPVAKWISYLELLSSRVECRVRDGVSDGISVISLSSAENSPARKMIVMGLTESALRQTGGTAILASDVADLEYRFGFRLSSEDQMRLEFEARWVAESSDRELVLSVPETDFSGSAQAPSWFWVKGARESGLKNPESSAGQLVVPAPTRWDELQRAELSTIAGERAWPTKQTEIFTQALQEDLGQKALADFPPEKLRALSPSGIEDYLDCPFIFAAKRLFGLSDQAEIDLEVDASRRGSLMHKVFELLTQEPFNPDFTDEELSQLLETARVDAELVLADERLWPSLKSRNLDLAKRFLAIESEFRKRFPNSKTVGREFEISGYLETSTGRLTRDHVDGAIPFVGRIDRVDADERGHAAIFDYKSSRAAAANHGSWLKNNQIQLLLYSLAIENGLTALEPKDVVSAIYYVARPLTRDTGFMIEEMDQDLYEVGDKRKGHRISAEEKRQLFTEAGVIIKKAIAGIQGGQFAPNPRDRKLCTDCRWSALCRAPHLNT